MSTQQNGRNWYAKVLNKKIGQKQYIFMNKRQRTSGGDVGW